jgi:hypothetical protein
MSTIKQTVHIPADRRLRLDLTLPEDIPAGQEEMTVILSPSVFTSSKRLGCMQGFGVLGRDTDIKAIAREEIIAMFEGRG